MNASDIRVQCLYETCDRRTMAPVIYAAGAPVTCAVCVQEWDEKYTALKILFMIFKLSLIDIWQYGNDQRNVQLLIVQHALLLSCNLHVKAGNMSIYLDILARTSAH